MTDPAAEPRVGGIVGLVDTHAHLMDAAFDADRTAVIERAAAASVAAMLLVGYDLPSSRAAVQLAASLPFARATVGVHPNSAAETSTDDFAAVAELARQPEVVAIGETGLDYYRHYTAPDRQRAALDWHLELAEEVSLPLIVHNRQADADIASALGWSVVTGRVPGVLHCFSSGDPGFLERMLQAGYFISFAGPLTFKTAHTLRDMARRVPLERVLVETDCPYLAPAPHRGQRNEPAFVRATAGCLADVLDVAFDRLVERLWANSLRVFPALEGAAHGVAS